MLIMITRFKTMCMFNQQERPDYIIIKFTLFNTYVNSAVYYTYVIITTQNGFCRTQICYVVLLIVNISIQNQQCVKQRQYMRIYNNPLMKLGYYTKYN